MSYLTKRGAFSKQMTKRTSIESIVRGAKGIPKEFIETSNRKRFKKIVNVLELIIFGVTVLTVGAILLFMTFPRLLPEVLATLEVSLVIIPLFLVNIMGLFVKSASEGTGVNWCARGIAAMFIFLTGGFLGGALALRTIVEAIF